MADPLSLVSAVVGLTAVGTSLFNQLYQFIDSFRSAPSNVLGLARELEELCSILTRLEKTLNNSVRHEVLWLGLRDVLESCVKRFSQLEVLVKAYGIRKGDSKLYRQWKKWRWTFQEKEVAALRVQLEAHKATLNITLLLSTHSETASVRDTADRIESAVQVVLQRLGEMQDGKNSIALYASSIGRYLHDPSFVSLSLVDYTEGIAGHDTAASLLPSGKNELEFLEEQSQHWGETNQAFDEIQTSDEMARQSKGVIQLQSEESQSQQEWVPLEEENPSRESQLLNGSPQVSGQEVVRPPEEKGRKEAVEENGEEEHNQFQGEEGQPPKVRERESCSPTGKGFNRPRGEEDQSPRNKLAKLQILGGIQAVSVAVICAPNDDDSDHRIQLESFSVDEGSQLQTQLVGFPMDDTQPMEEGKFQLSETSINPSERDHSQLAAEETTHPPHDGEDSQLQHRDEKTQPRMDEVSKYLKERVQRLEKERTPKIQPEIGKEEEEKEEEEEEKEKMASIWSFDQGFTNDSTTTCTEKRLADQLDRTQLRVELQRSCEKTANQVQEEETTGSKRTSIQGAEWERVQHHLVDEWKRRRRDAGRMKSEKKGKLNAGNTTGQGRPQDVYAIYWRAKIPSGSRKSSMAFPKAYTRGEALGEQIIGCTEQAKCLVIHKIATRKEQEYLWAIAKRARHYTKHVKDAIHQAPSTVQGCAGEYLKYIHIADQTPLPITVEMMPGGGLGSKLNSIT